jgi:hypothetical protein
MSDNKNRIDVDGQEKISDEALENIVGGGVSVGTPGDTFRPPRGGPNSSFAVNAASHERNR